MSEFVNTLKKAKWDSIVIAVLTFLLGLVYVLLPAESASVVTTLFGVAMLLVGVTAFVRVGRFPWRTFTCNRHGIPHHRYLYANPSYRRSRPCNNHVRRVHHH